MKSVSCQICDMIKRSMSRKKSLMMAKTLIDNDGKTLTMSYFGKDGQKNDIFHYRQKTKTFWINDCGWLTLTTANRINNCFTVLNIPYHVYSSNKRFFIRHAKTNKKWFCGDGKIESFRIDSKLQ